MATARHARPPELVDASLEEIMGKYVALPWYYTKMAVVMGSNVGGATGDATVGMPFLPDLFLKG